MKKGRRVNEFYRNGQTENILIGRPFVKSRDKEDKKGPKSFSSAIKKMLKNPIDDRNIGAQISAEIFFKLFVLPCYRFAYGIE